MNRDAHTRASGVARIADATPCAVSGIARQVFLGLAVLTMASTAATAQTTTLICNLIAPNVFTEDEPTTIELNEAQSSVAVHFSESTLSLNGGRYPEFSIGPLQATFAADTISFSDPPNALNYTLNRLTGRFTRLFKGEFAQGWTCQAGKKQF